MNCRHCSTPLHHTFLDLGYAPPSNAYLCKDDLTKSEVYYPLRVMVCTSCWLVQTDDYTKADDLFSANYAYFSSTSVSWLSHASKYARTIIEKLKLNQSSFVVEVASNDGYLLKNFLSSGIPCLGIEPTASTAFAAERLGIPVVREFFSEELGAQLSATGKQADLIIGNNVYAHVPDINDFTKGLRAALKPRGTVTLEIPHLMRLMEKTQFDTIYHEHFSYLSLYTVQNIFDIADLKVYDVEELPTHGGSLRVYGCHREDPRIATTSVMALLAEEAKSGLQNIETYQGFQGRAEKIKNDLLNFLIEQKRNGKKVVAYGAAAKGNTLLNFAGVKPDLISFVCDAALAKQGKFMPGSHIPIFPPDKLIDSDADYLLILPWNIAEEVKQQNTALISHGVKFLIAVPSLKVL